MRVKTKAKLPAWLTEKQTAALEAGYSNYGTFASWWAIEGGKAGVEATCNRALDNLAAGLTETANGARWAFGDFGQYSGISAGRNTNGIRTPTEGAP